MHSQHDECKGLIYDDVTGDVIEQNHTAAWEDWTTQVFKDCTAAIIASNTRVGGKLDDIQVRAESVVGFVTCLGKCY